MTLITQADLNQATGTSQYHQYLFGLKYTDGIDFLVEKCKCYWLLDAIASYYATQIKFKGHLNSFCVWNFTKRENDWVLTARADTGEEPFVTQEFVTNFDKYSSITDLKLFLCNGVLMVPSEY